MNENQSTQEEVQKTQEGHPTPPALTKEQEGTELTPTKATPPPLPTSETDELKKQVKALQTRLHEIEKAKKQETRKAEIEAIIAPLSDTLKTIYRRTDYNSASEEEYNHLKEAITKEVATHLTEVKRKGVVFKRPRQTEPTDGKATDSETEAVLKKLNL